MPATAFRHSNRSWNQGDSCGTIRRWLRDAPLEWFKRLGITLAAAAAVMAVTQAVGSGGVESARPPQLAMNEPITEVDARFRAAGWVPHPDREPLPIERKLAGNNLASLSACSGTGMGLCRYDYRRGHQQFAVITVPGVKGVGVVQNWFISGPVNRPGSQHQQLPKGGRQ